ncbi:ribosome-associated translation inhibitor RaiA, partial [Staphylococcus aureus]|nr:ribosome-associated translation inhibitor RaiA [Staphylococcus aureus]
MQTPAQEVVMEVIVSGRHCHVS